MVPSSEGFVYLQANLSSLSGSVGSGIRRFRHRAQTAGKCFCGFLFGRLCRFVSVCIRVLPPLFVNRELKYSVGAFATFQRSKDSPWVKGTHAFSGAVYREVTPVSFSLTGRSFP